MKKVRVSKIFVAGGQPSVTYVAREAAGNASTLEDGIRAYLEAGHKALTVTGPTKSGKTVLCRKVVSREDGVWISGGNVRNEDEFWTQVAEKLDLNSASTESETNSDTIGTGAEMSGQLKIPFVAQGGAKGSLTGSTSSSAGRTVTKASNIRSLSAKALVESDVPLVIDDFHYIDRSVQRAIVRSLKEPIFDGLRAILIAVPHRAFDAVRSEREMTGRVDQLSVELWSEADLRSIPEQRFPELNVTCPEELVHDFIVESQGSPHLMQEFCRQLCEINGVKETADSPMELKLDDRSSFYTRIAASTAKPAFDLLARGPRQRTDRKQRRFQDGSSGDIYLAVLRAIAHSGAKSRLTYEDIRSSLRTLLADDVPQAQEIGRVLVKMTEIAREKIEGEAVLEWDEEQTVLYVADPFFAFYLRWLQHK